MTNFKVGDQVAYFPGHIKFGDFAHPEVEFGIVTSEVWENTVRVRYWKNGENGLELEDYSKMTSTKRLCLHKIKPQEEIDEILKTLWALNYKSLLA